MKRNNFRFLVIGTNFISDNFAKAVAAVNSAATLGFTEKSEVCRPTFRSDLNPEDITDTYFEPTLFGVAVGHDCKITAVMSRKNETGTAFCQKHSLDARVVNTLEEAVALYDEGVFDAAYVASPNLCHEEQSVFLLKHGISVLCEKPIATSVDGYRLMREAADNSGAHLMEAMRPAHDGVIEKIRTLIKEISPIRTAHFEFSQYSSRYDRFKNGENVNTFNPEMGNSALFDLGVYAVADALLLFGKPESVKYDSVFLENGFECSGNMIFTYNGMTLSVTYSKVSEGINPSAINGENGAITIDRLSEPKVVKIRRGKKGEPEDIDFVPTQNNMVFEISDFISVCEGNTEIESVCSSLSEAQMQILSR